MRVPKISRLSLSSRLLEAHTTDFGIILIFALFPLHDCTMKGKVAAMKWSWVICMLLLLISSISSAGGDSWLFKVKSMHELKKDRYILTLTPLTPGKQFPLNCDQLVVHVQYDSKRWLLYGDKKITRSKHDKAIDLIKQAYKDRKPIKIGSMGEGFGFLDDQFPCEVYSRALSVLNINGKEEIYSFYK